MEKNTCKISHTRVKLQCEIFTWKTDGLRLGQRPKSGPRHVR